MLRAGSVVALQDDFHGGLVVDRFLVGPQRAERVIDIGNRRDPGGQGDFGPGEPVGIARSVEFLMMMARRLNGGVVGAVSGVDQDLRAVDRMSLNLEKLLGRQRAGLAQNLCGNREFSDVVQGRGLDQRRHLLDIKPESGP